MNFPHTSIARHGSGELLNFSAIAREFKVSARTIGRLVSEGILPAVTVRKRRKIARRDVLRYFGQQKETDV